MLAKGIVVAGRYRIVRTLGAGGMKQVYLAEDQRLAARKCALAEVIDGLASTAMRIEADAAFKHEAEMLAKLDYEHIPRVYDSFSEGNSHYLVMEYVSGLTLEEVLRRCGGKLPEADVIQISLQICDTLEYLHSRQPPVIFRDLKPSNLIIVWTRPDHPDILSRSIGQADLIDLGKRVFVTALSSTYTGQIKLIDFGIARHFFSTKTATKVGTQGYAPPEQYRGKTEPRSDLYALGALMHHLLSGRDPAVEPPFSFPPIERLCSCSGPTAQIIHDALAYEPAMRVPKASEFRKRLIGAQKAIAQAGATTARIPPSVEMQQQNGTLLNGASRLGWKVPATTFSFILATILFASIYYGYIRPREPTRSTPLATSRETVEPALPTPSETPSSIADRPRSFDDAVSRLLAANPSKTRREIVEFMRERFNAGDERFRRIPGIAEALSQKRRARRSLPKVALTATASESAPETRPSWQYFTIGSTKAEVLALQGTPTEVQNYDALGEEEWYYGYCRVEFSEPDGRVKSYDNSCGRLRIRMR